MCIGYKRIRCMRTSIQGSTWCYPMCLVDLTLFVGCWRPKTEQSSLSTAPTLHSWKFSDTSVSWTSISLGVGAAVGVPAVLPHDGDPIVPPGEEVVRPSKTFRNFFISCQAFVFFRLGIKRKKTTLLSLFSQSSGVPLRYKIPTRLGS